MSKRKITSGEGWAFLGASDADDRADDGPVVSKAPAEQRVKVVVEKRVGGRTVTVLQDLVLSPVDLKQLSKDLKHACGTGGTVAEGCVELQGDCRDRVRDWLSGHGWGVKG